MNNISLPPSAAKKGDGYQTPNITAIATRAMAALISKCNPDASQRENTLGCRGILSAIGLFITPVF
jgi:hypothetical protein